MRIPPLIVLLLLVHALKADIHGTITTSDRSSPVVGRRQRSSSSSSSRWASASAFAFASKHKQQPAAAGPRSWIRIRPSAPFVQSWELNLASATSSADDETSIDAGTSSNCGGVYRPFAEYAWSKLQDSGLFVLEDSSTTVPEELATNTSPARGMEEGTEVTITVRSVRGVDSSPVRLARYALLETLAPPASDDDDSNNEQNNRLAVPNAIHVLNLVVFPNPDVTFGASSNEALPVLGLDLVTMPGNKHLVAVDFQPVLPPAPLLSDDEEEEGQGRRTILPGQYADFEDRLEDLHRKHTVDSKALPWGGDIPPVAQRYFSPFAIWTRLGGDDYGALNVVRKEVYSAFCDYVDLYVDLMTRVQHDIAEGVLQIRNDGGENENAKQGQSDYLMYRRENDPARPMLKSLYGEEWTEKLIGDVLFRMI